MAQYSAGTGSLIFSLECRYHRVRPDYECSLQYTGSSGLKNFQFLDEKNDCQEAHSWESNPRSFDYRSVILPLHQHVTHTHTPKLD